MNYFYIRDENGRYYRNSDSLMLPKEPAWVENKSEASICVEERAALLIQAWGDQKAMHLEPIKTKLLSTRPTQVKKLNTGEVK